MYKLTERSAVRRAKTSSRATGELRPWREMAPTTAAAMALCGYHLRTTSGQPVAFFGKPAVHKTDVTVAMNQSYKRWLMTGALRSYYFSHGRVPAH